MRKTLFVIIKVGVVFLLCIGAYVGWKAIDNSINNVCVLEYPRHVISGHISRSIGLIAEGPHMYYLFCRGKRKLTGEKCTEFVLVTQREYERRVYDE